MSQNILKIFQFIKEKIEYKRNSQYLFWRIIIKIKDFLWKFYLYIPGNQPVLIHLFPEYKVIYVEIPRAGCTSIKYALKDFKGEWNDIPDGNFHRWFGHTLIPFRKLKKILTVKYKDWIKFTVVRSPYDRFCSFYYLYSHLNKTNLSSDSIDIFLKNFKKSYWYKIDPHGRPQTRIIGNDLSIYDFIGKMENMREVFNFLSKTFKKNIREIKLGKSNRKIVLTNSQKEIIYKLYQEDFKILGYEK